MSAECNAVHAPPAMRRLGLYERDYAQRSESLELQVLLVGKP
jgi:hypothetical protein